MKKIKHWSALIVAVILMFTMMQIPLLTASAAGDETVYVKIRYNRPDGDYSDWNLWVWETDKDGKQVDFMGKDDDGVFAVVESTKEAGEVNFIVRKGDWAEKATGDEAVSLSDGDKEVVVTQGDASTTVSEPKAINRDFDNVKLNVHYYRFGQDYDEWDVWSWIDDGKGVAFTDEDDYGKIAIASFDNVKGAESIGVIIRKPDWSAKDCDIDRFVNLAYANNDGEINAYFLQGDEKIYYYPDEPIKQPAISSFKIDSLNDFSFKVNAKLVDNTKVVLKEDNKVIDESKYELTINDNKLGGKIKVDSKIDINKTYTLEIKGYTSAMSSFGKIYETEDFAKLYTYDGDLGALYSKDSTKFVLWAPTASKVQVAFYGTDGKDYTCAAKKTVDMVQGENGTWSLEQSGDLNGTYYNYLVTINGKTNEVTDPYAKAVGVNGNRGMVVDLDSTDPEGWDEDTKPELKDATDSVIYEIHIRDFSISEDSGVSVEYRGKYNGFWEEGTKVPGTDIKTGIDHLKELGVTTVHLLPTFDQRSIDETKLDKAQFNWGYDPQNYNAVEGSYSSDPYTAEVRITEFKEMVQALHKAGIRVVMDVVYNHTGATADSLFNLAVPDYYYRQDVEGNFSNGSGCGNELASERSMVRKMIVESVVYWAEEYHIDGFRFDLMGLHDITTMKEIRTELDKIDKTIIMYGEGWTGGTSSLSSSEAALKANVPLFGEMQIAAFSDDIRDGIKGHVFTNTEPAFVNGGDDFEDTIKFGIVGSTEHEGIDYSNIGRDHTQVDPWANEPYQTINYASAHDNLTLWDRLQTTNPDATDEELQAMNKMSAAIVYTSQGIPFMQAGEEFARTKVKEDGTFDENSYSSPDSVNQLDWSRKDEYSDLFNYYKGLIELRKSHKAFRMNSTEDIQNNLTFLTEGTDFTGKNVVAYTLKGTSVGDSWENIAVVFNANKEDVEVTLPTSDWTVVVDGAKAGVEELAKITGNKVTVPAGTSYVLVDTKSYEESKVVVPTDDKESNDDNNGGTNTDTNTEEATNNNANSNTNNKKTSNKTLTKTGSVGTTAVIAVGMGLVLVGALVIRKRQRN